MHKSLLDETVDYLNSRLPEQSITWTVDYLNIDSLKHTDSLNCWLLRSWGQVHVISQPDL